MPPHGSEKTNTEQRNGKTYQNNEPIPIAVLRQQNELIAASFQWANEAGSQADLPELRQWHPDLMAFDTWLDRKGRAKLENLFADESRRDA